MPSVKNLETGQTHAVSMFMFEHVWESRCKNEPHKYLHVPFVGMSLSDISEVFIDDVPVEPSPVIVSTELVKIEKVQEMSTIPLIEEEEEEDKLFVNAPITAKKVLQISTEDIPTWTEKKRGRPKKEVVADPFAPPKVKKPRGRPKKEGTEWH